MLPQTRRSRLVQLTPKLEDVCLIPCEETGDLNRAIEAYKGSFAKR